MNRSRWMSILLCGAVFWAVVLTVTVATGFHWSRMMWVGGGWAVGTCLLVVYWSLNPRRGEQG